MSTSDNDCYVAFGVRGVMDHDVPRNSRLRAIARDVVKCRACPRLDGYLRDAKVRWPDHRCRPVPGWGDSRARLLIVGLAPGMHGANRTGRMFTIDSSGRWIYGVLHEVGLSAICRKKALRVAPPETISVPMPPAKPPTIRALSTASAVPTVKVVPASDERARPSLPSPSRPGSASHPAPATASRTGATASSRGGMARPPPRQAGGRLEAPDGGR